MAKRWKTCVDLRANLISTKVSASHRKSTQVHASPGQTETQANPSLQLASTCVSVSPGLKASVWRQRMGTVILPTLLRVLSTSCCLCYRRQNVSNFTISLSFKMKFMTDVLSLLSLLPISKSLFACKWMMQRKHKIKHLFWSQFTFTENPSKTRFPCARSLWCYICFRFTCQSVITHSRLRKTRSK